MDVEFAKHHKYLQNRIKAYLNDAYNINLDNNGYMPGVDIQIDTVVEMLVHFMDFVKAEDLAESQSKTRQK